MTGNMTGQFSDALRGRLAYNNSWAKTDGLLPAQAGTEPAGTNYAKCTKFPNYSLSGNLDWVASPKLFFGVRGGYYFSDVNDSNMTEEPRIIFATGNTRCTGAVGSSTCAFPEIPSSFQQSTGFSSVPGGGIQQDD